MKKYCIYIIILVLTYEGLLSQTEEVRIKTPLCHHPDMWFPVRDFTWDQEQIEDCKELWLYDGGILSGTVTKPNDYYFSGEEKNTYIPTHECICLAINDDDIFLGTVDIGLYKGTIDQDGSVNWDNATTYSQLNNKTINDIFISDDSWIVCTNGNGVYTSTNDGSTWNQNLYGSTVTSVMKKGNDFFISLTSGSNKVYKSTNDGVDWTGLNLFPDTYCLSYYNTYIYAGTESGVWISTNNGDYWSSIPNTGNWDISAIYNYNDYLFIGLYDDNDQEYSIKYFYNNTWYDGSIDNFTDVKINDFNIYEISGDDYILAATDNGIYCDELDSDPADNWKKVEELHGSVSPEEETVIKNLYIFNNNLWFVSSGGDLWDNAVVIENSGTGDPTIPSKWNNFNCAGYAWHYTEGGISGSNLQYPNDHNYVATDVEKKHDPNITDWDYLIANSTDIENGNWDKVTMSGWSHSGIKSYLSSYPNPFVEDNIRVISKWGVDGPLVEHYLMDNPYGYELVQYWKSNKEIDDDNERITKDDDERFIGRQLTSSSTIDASYSGIEFYVAPMYDHCITLKHGFHAEYGCDFHAYVNSSCSINWEDLRTVKVSEGEKEERRLKESINTINEKIHILVYPNPTSKTLTIKAVIHGKDEIAPINIKLHSFRGELVKDISITNGFETNINVSSLSSGAYLLTAQTSINGKDDKGNTISASEIIIIQK